jgi:hypothetical protein
MPELPAEQQEDGQSVGDVQSNPPLADSSQTERVTTNDQAIDSTLECTDQYYPAGHPCIDRLKMLCDDSPEGDPQICFFNPEENPQGYRCVDGAMIPRSNAEDCLPHDSNRELYAPHLLLNHAFLLR